MDFFLKPQAQRMSHILLASHVPKVEGLSLPYRDGENTADPETTGAASTSCSSLRSALRGRQTRPITVLRS